MKVLLRLHSNQLLEGAPISLSYLAQPCRQHSTSRVGTAGANNMLEGGPNSLIHVPQPCHTKGTCDHSKGTYLDLQSTRDSKDESLSHLVLSPADCTAGCVNIKLQT